MTLEDAREDQIAQRHLEANLSPIEKRLFDLILIEELIHEDQVVETTGLSSSETLAALCEMEMRWIIRRMPRKQLCIALVTSFALGSGEDNIRPQKGVSVYKQSLWHDH